MTIGLFRPFFFAMVAVSACMTMRAGEVADSTKVDFNAGDPMSVGLVLSGGGAKGIAHIGVIRALEENNIPIDYVAGTSMGAIVGGLYAVGYSPDEMMELITSSDFSYWSTGRIDPAKVYYFSRETPRPTMFKFEINTNPKDSAKTAGSAVPSSLISPLPMNFAFMDLFAKYTAQCSGDFDRLMVPFRCVASDVEGGYKVVHRSGSLGEAIRTSMTFPIVFQPIRVNGVLLYDGGIFDNFPVDVMTKDFAPGIMIGVDVAASAKEPQTSLMDQIDNLVMRRQSYSLPEELGIKLHVDLDEFSLLDFEAARAIEKIGYDHAVAMMDSIKTRVTSRISPVARRLRRAVFKSKTPELVFDSIHVSGGDERQNRYIDYLFRPAHSEAFDVAHARESYYRALSPGRLRDLYPTAIYNDTTSMFTLDLRASVKDRLGIGVGGYITSATNSYLFLNATWRTLSYTSLNMSLNAWVGQSYMAMLANASVDLSTPIPSSLGLTAVLSRQRFYESDHLFYEVKTPSFIVDSEYFGRLDWTWAVGSRAKMSAAVGYGHLFDNFFRTNSRVSFDIGRDKTTYDLGQVRLEYMSNTLNSIDFPTAGAAYNFTAMGVLGKFHFTSADDLIADERSNPRWLQVESRTRNYFDIAKHFSLGLETDVLLSTRKLHDNYNASVVNAPTYNPTAASQNTFNTGYRANSFIGVGIVPVYKYNSSLSARLSLHGFLPVRSIEEDNAGRAYYGDWFSNPQIFGQLDVSYSLPFATISAYGNYATGRSKGWNVGVSFGVFLLAPKFLR